MRFEELKKGIEEAPMTWLPALFMTIVKASLDKSVFQKGGMARYCRQEEAKLENRKSKIVNPK